MAFTAAYAFDAGSTGLSLKAALVNTAGTPHATHRDLSAGFAEIGANKYAWSYESHPDGFRGTVVFYTGTLGSASSFSGVTVLATEVVEPPAAKRDGELFEPLTQTAGVPLADWLAEDHYSGGTAGRTILQGGNDFRIKQAGALRRVVLYRPSGVMGPGTRKIVVARPASHPITAATTWTVAGVSESQTNPTTEGFEVVNLKTPIECQAHDYLGLYLSGSGDQSVWVGAFQDADSTVYYGNGELATGGTLASADAGWVIQIAGFDIVPTLTATGDSIGEGHNTASSWHGHLHTGQTLGGNAKAEIWAQAAAILGDGFRYQNLCLGGVTWAWVRSLGVPACVATGSPIIVVACGVNDVEAARTWVSVEADMDAVRAIVPPWVRLVICAILPWTDATDEQAATIRTFNANYEEWCERNGAEFHDLHAYFGQTRVSTGQPDDLKTQFDQDGVHLTEAGVFHYGAKIAEHVANGNRAVRATGGSVATRLLGPGPTDTTITVRTSGQVPVSDATVQVTTDEDGSRVVAEGTTDDFGQVSFRLDSGTYYVWRRKVGATFTNPYELEVA